ncbi:hypothetical protein ACWOAH_10810 [Vagococcus vulneris]|uniref:Uncharacterized protein n=1 Tax=Vagococcus vulneris TaxID=1977869 RepID=A0A429ZSN8_9ENTE|nr:hypothetical protein [Vagococcus vulneris]RST96736.1 hypothetical protein CBF37_10770 [Vagococcus vulneris]
MALQSKIKKNLLFYGIALFGIIVMVIFGIKALYQSENSSKYWFVVLEMFLGILLCLLPQLIEQIFKLTTPVVLKNMYWLFILFSVFLGTGLSFYSRFYYWDKFLHFSSAALLVALGFGILSCLMPKFNHLSLGTIILFGFFFAMTMGVVWEFYEFTFDGLLGLNMQRFATSSGKNLVGRAVLMDTMGDLFTNTAGALTFSIFCFFKGKSTPKWLQLLAFSLHKKNK